MTPQDFIAKWRSGGDERRDAQPFFEDLCRLVGHPTPREADPDHTWFTYEYGANKTSGGDGWADVWKKGFFGWEAKGTNRSLEKAYEQLKMYADALQNPPLLVVSDLQTIVVHTNFTNAVKREIRFTVEQLAEYETRQILDAVFNHPETLRPGITRTAITQEAAEKFTTLAQVLRDRNHEPHAVAHFLNRLLFCMFAEDIGLLPSRLFSELVEGAERDPALFEQWSSELFRAMQLGGALAFKRVDWFNGGLFEDAATLHLEVPELKLLAEACRLDWSEIEPSIFGTLFERGLDPDKRSQLGAHYTDPATIMKIVQPVIIEPWLRDWESEKIELRMLLAKASKSVSKPAQNRFNAFLERLRRFTVLDPACGSGNFLYLALRALKDIEKRVLIEGEALGLGRQFPAVGPSCVKGLELNTYAAELARVTIWIGEIQWMIQNGYGAKKDPILQPLEQIENRDALLDSHGKAATWPSADAIVGNPPFLGGSKLLRELGTEYAACLRKTYDKRVPGGADLVCYWFDKTSSALLSGARYAGLVATNSIRGGANRKVLTRIVEKGRIFEAWSDESWVNDGAAVRVSLICFESTSADERRPGDIAVAPVLNGQQVTNIHADLTAAMGAQGIDLTSASTLKENIGVSFQGASKKGKFEIDARLARAWLLLPNPNARPNSDVVKPWANGYDLSRRPQEKWIIDFGSSMSERDAASYEQPFGHVAATVKPEREKKSDQALRKFWWRLGRPRVELRAAMRSLPRFIATVAHSKHRFFVWLPITTSPDQALITVARDDDTTFGILHSRPHEVWSLRMCTHIGVGNDPRYTPTTCFETFPFPSGLTPVVPPADYANLPTARCIALAAQALVAARDRWLNPPEWTEQVPEVVPGYPDRIFAKSGHEADLKKRTLTNLYNARPAWLASLHADLDAAVAAAYGWEWPLSDDEILGRLFKLNEARAALN